MSLSLCRFCSSGPQYPPAPCCSLYPGCSCSGVSGGGGARFGGGPWLGPPPVRRVPCGSDTKRQVSSHQSASSRVGSSRLVSSRQGWRGARARGHSHSARLTLADFFFFFFFNFDFFSAPANQDLAGEFEKKNEKLASNLTAASFATARLGFSYDALPAMLSLCRWRGRSAPLNMWCERDYEAQRLRGLSFLF